MNAKIDSSKHSSNGVSVPAEALKEGGINASTPPEQRAIRPFGIQKTDGPVKRENGAYAPAEYPIEKKGRKMIRRDR